VTLAHAAKFGIEADVVIRADGGTGRMRVNGFVPPQRPIVASDCLVIDIADQFDAHAQRDSRHRLDDYRAWGWQIVGAKPEEM